MITGILMCAVAVVLGINPSFTSNHHDPSASLFVDGRLVAACEEERFTRTKTSLGWFPYRSISNVLEISGLSVEDVDLVVSPGSTAQADLLPRIRKSLKHYFSVTPSIQLFLHPICHIAGAFYPSGFYKALGLSIDGSGDKLSVVVADCSLSNGIKILCKFPFDNSGSHLFFCSSDP